MRRGNDVIIRSFWMKRPDGSKKLVNIKFDKSDLSKPIYILRSD